MLVSTWGCGEPLPFPGILSRSTCLSCENISQASILTRTLPELYLPFLRKHLTGKYSYAHSARIVLAFPAKTPHRQVFLRALCLNCTCLFSENISQASIPTHTLSELYLPFLRKHLTGKYFRILHGFGRVFRKLIPKVYQKVI